ncbi:hypothetical protein ACN2WE_05345 [Streptomyces sp. cg28]|uniref:hypothetical protein n=1 Tax=Streptomyces sp. cg28 TaxID=3403457 RepID=UPI003B20C908
MGQSTNATLAYGYDLGEGHELVDLAWMTGDEYDLAGACEQRLLAELVGFTETWETHPDGYYEREREAKARLGVEIYTHCSDNAPMLLLATHVITAYRGFPEAVDLAAYASMPDSLRWNERLQEALNALQITSPQTEPGWLLCSYWG